MSNFRRRPVDIEARQVTPDTVADIVAWCGGVQVEEQDALDPNRTYVGVNVPTLSGVVRVSEGDYVAKSPQGGFFAASAMELHANFEEV